MTILRLWRRNSRNTTVILLLLLLNALLHHASSEEDKKPVEHALSPETNTKKTEAPLKEEQKVVEKADATAEKTVTPPREAPKEKKSAPIDEDTGFHPYDEADDETLKDDGENPDLEDFDFDPSEGLTFFVGRKEKSCYYQDIKELDDVIRGAYIVSTDQTSAISFEVIDPTGKILHTLDSELEDDYEIKPGQVGVHELCFYNPHHVGVMVTHVTKTLQSQHPVQRTHVNVLAKYVSHLDIKLGEIESEQRLQQIRTERHIKMQQATHRRMTYDGVLECIVYMLICFFQVFYIRRLLENPRQIRSWV
uniref:Uncharacterized protein AlNc14C28G2705 n=1 Tax=Albugo laibachii Nc14 TaxID=890382 RepID=F0W777_9STRA|nr:conserved hypothetical protein [Albugo laibachii Nc14]|eukprot:CCA16976.1 conserved hypothetical protein [Albugo laibachii Nc14]